MSDLLAIAILIGIIAVFSRMGTYLEKIVHNKHSYHKPQ